jgi:hypothetical protein
MEVFQLILLFTLISICFLITAELFAPKGIEAFTGSASQSTFWMPFVAPRSDIDSTKEDPNYIRDPRYFNDYTDVSRIGSPSDFCRIVASKADPTNLFFACALAGTEHLDSTKFRTPGTKDGFRISYDDYMQDINGDGRADYCRILRMKDGSYQPVCSYAGDFGFDGTETGSFFTCEDDWTWNEEDEIPMFDSGDVPGENKIMSDYQLNDILDTENTKIIYVYDFINMWTFLVELAAVEDSVEVALMTISQLLVLSVAVISPFTLNFLLGLTVPIPTFPAFLIVK